MMVQYFACFFIVLKMGVDGLEAASQVESLSELLSKELLFDASAFASNEAAHRSSNSAAHQHRLVVKAKSKVAARKRVRLTASQRMAEELRLSLERAQQAELESATRSAKKDAAKLKLQLEHTKHEAAKIEDRRQAEGVSFSKMKNEAARRLGLADGLHRKLAVQLAAESKEETKEALELKEKTFEVRKLKAELSSATQEKDSLQTILSAEHANLLEHKANSSRAAAMVNSEARSIKHDRQGFLDQIVDITADESKLKKTKNAEDKKVNDLKKQAHLQLALKLKETVQQEDAHNKKVSLLLQESESDRVSLRSLTWDTKAAKVHAASLRKDAANMALRLRFVMDQADDLKTARDAAVLADTRLKKDNADKKGKVVSTREQISSLRKSLAVAQKAAASGEAKATRLEARRVALASQLQAALKAEDTVRAQGQTELHATMLSAAGKIRVLEDDKEGLSEQLGSQKALLQTAAAESASAKQAETSEATQELRALRKVAALSDALTAAQKASDASKHRVAELSGSVATLQEERNTAVSTLAQRLAVFSATQAKVEQLESTVSKEGSQDKTFSGMNTQLAAQISALSGQTERANVLAVGITALQAADRKKTARNDQLTRQMETLQNIKESEGTDLETARNESSTWGASAKDLEQQLADAKAELLASQKQRVSAMQKAKEASSQEDKYFEDNFRLQDQSKALSTQLQGVLVASNRSEDEEQKMRQQMVDMRGDQARDQRNSAAALEDVQRELAHAEDHASEAVSIRSVLQGELSTTRLVLDDQQRRRLGLPPAATAAKVAIANLAATPTSAPTAVAMDAPKQAAPATPTPLAGEPMRPEDNAEATLAAVDNPKPVPLPQASSALQRLAAYFATPLQH